MKREVEREVETEVERRRERFWHRICQGCLMINFF